jgi:hypothetical protein
MYIPPPPHVLTPNCAGGAALKLAHPKNELRNLFRLMLSFVPVDEDWYGTIYPDIKPLIAKNLIGTPAQHYRNLGYFEGKLPFEPAVDEKWYIETYPDVKTKWVDEGRGRAKDHFIQFGYVEGRLPCEPQLDEAWYVNQYPDALPEIERSKSRSVVEHYLKSGYRRGYLPRRIY